jgi:hypothetical protein
VVIYGVRAEPAQCDLTCALLTCNRDRRDIKGHRFRGSPEELIGGRFPFQLTGGWLWAALKHSFMKRRWTANTWLLTVLMGVLCLIGIDVGRRLAARPVADPVPKEDAAPKFKVGDVAPRFTLPDSKQVKRTFPDIVKRDTLLVFSCGCNQCREFQTYLGMVEKKLGPKAPDIISVNSTQPGAAAAWIRDTGLKQTMLYGAHGAGETQVYHGSPCPRAFRVSPERRVTYIGQSRADHVPVQLIGRDVARELGLNSGNDKTSQLPPAPEMKWLSGGPPGVDPAAPAALAGSHSH